MRTRGKMRRARFRSLAALDSIVSVFRVRHEERVSAGVKLQVVENDNVKMLKIDGVTQSIINKKSLYTRGYWDYFIPTFYLQKNPTVLLIGLGLGTSVCQLRGLLGRRAKLEIVEKNGGLVDFSIRHNTGLRHEKIKIGDGAAYVSERKRAYDLIVLDAYERGGIIPEKFLSQAFIKNADAALKKEGILAINYAMNFRNAFKFSRFKKLLKKRFKIYAVSAGAPGMLIIICSKSINKEAMLDTVRGRMRVDESNAALLKEYELMRTL